MPLPKKYTPEENAIIARVYPDGGPEALVAALPNRPRGSLLHQASVLGVKLSPAQLRARRAAAQRKRFPKVKDTSAGLDAVSDEFKQVPSIFDVGGRMKK